jgi:NAD(P)-dependent dehydrogenase (short-subunit alcohol dehydrogenase family)
MTGQEDTDVHERHRPGVPLGRPADAREIAAVVAFLASPGAAYVTGASWLVDGGMTRMGPQAGSHLPDDSWRTP